MIGYTPMRFFIQTRELAAKSPVYWSALLENQGMVAQFSFHISGSRSGWYRVPITIRLLFWIRFCRKFNPAIITYWQGDYGGAGKLPSSLSYAITIVNGKVMNSVSEEYQDTQTFLSLNNLKPVLMNTTIRCGDNN